ncbi:MAG TPA: nuclear transport factor 2 family protein [Gaiellaceae bacterium]|nr:nuclear transport factor 2 family protein [Gaiellaceae bacterium]
MTAYHHRVHVQRPQITVGHAAVIALAAAVIALAAWIVVDRETDARSDAREATTLVDELNAAWSAGDAPAVAALFARGGVAQLQGHTFVGADAIGSHAATASRFAGFRVARVAPVSVWGEFATTLAEYRYGSSSALGTLLAVYRLRDGKILQEWTFKLGATEPFTDAAP